MKDLGSKLHQQFPEAVGKTIEIIAREIEIYDDNKYNDEVNKLFDQGEYDCESLAIGAGIISHKTPKGYLAVTTTDNTLYLVKV